uniref:Aldo_ket_red domain-containing protein n=1 Tax=Globodera pallida TaxID=36090 RepID=A0A183C8J6_GLOPA
MLHLDQEVPEAVKGKCGLDTVLENLQAAVAVDKTVLSVNYRSHPAITECVEAAAYGPHGLRLTSGKTVQQMSMLTGLDGIKLPSAGEIRQAVADQTAERPDERVETINRQNLEPFWNR